MVPLMKQELFTLPEQLSLLTDFSEVLATKYVVFCVVYLWTHVFWVVYLWTHVFRFVFCFSLSNGFWLPLCISGMSSGSNEWGSCCPIYKFLYSVLYIIVCLLFFVFWPLFVCCPLSFDHCFVCPYLIYGFWLPLWYL